MNRILVSLFWIPALWVRVQSATAETFRIELDYMVDTSVGGPHSHQPGQDVIDAVVQMFACQGHTLIVDVDDAIPHFDATLRDPDNADFFNYNGAVAAFGSYRQLYFDRAGQSGWHYMVFGHQYTNLDNDGNQVLSGSSGLAQISGLFSFVSLGDFDGEVGTPFEQAATLAHEFGHNLGLTHCGDMQCWDDTKLSYVGPRPPNLPSVMSYAYQLIGVKNFLVCSGLAPETVPFKDLDYSHGRMCTLDETAMDEAMGTLLKSVDWDCSGTISGAPAVDTDSNPYCFGSGPFNQVVSDFDEWANVASPAKSKTAEELRDVRVAECISAEEVQVLKRGVEFACTEPTLTTEACLIGGMRYVRANGTPAATGACEDADDSLLGSYGQAADGSVLIVEPGDFPDGAQLIGNGTAAIIISAGSAVFR